MGGKAADAAAAFNDLKAAVLAEVERLGAAGVRRDKIVATFAGRVPRRTAYRWISEILASPAPARRLETLAAEAAAGRAQAPDPGAALARDVGAVLPPRPVDALGATTAARPGGRLAFMDILQQCLDDAEQVRAYARLPDGSPRSARLILAASKHLRQTIETAARIQETLASMAQLDEFHRAIMAGIAEESPATAERIVLRLRQISNTWADGGS